MLYFNSNRKWNQNTRPPPNYKSYTQKNNKQILHKSGWTGETEGKKNVGGKNEKHQSLSYLRDLVFVAVSSSFVGHCGRTQRLHRGPKFLIKLFLGETNRGPLNGIIKLLAAVGMLAGKASVCQRDEKSGLLHAPCSRTFNSP